MIRMVQRDISMYAIFGLIFFSPVFWYISQDWRNEDLFFGSVTTAQIQEDCKNLGIISYNDTVKIEFNIQNTGSQPLMLKTVEPFRKNMTAIWDKTPIAPGQSGKIVICFKPNIFGAFIETVEITCNTLQQYYYLRLSGNVRN